MIRRRLLLFVAATAQCSMPHESPANVLQPHANVKGSATLLASAVPGATAQSELATGASIGDTALRVASVENFRVGGVVRIHAGYPNQEDHRIRSMTHNSLWLSGKGVEFPHNKLELLHALPVAPTCPGNCSSRAPCVSSQCLCPKGYSGDDCSLSLAACPQDCSGNGLCHMGLCNCHAGFAGALCMITTAGCPGNCSGHGICGTGGLCSCEPGFSGSACQTASPDCLNNCTGHGRCSNSECTCDFGYTGDDCSVVAGGCAGNCSAHGECLSNGECLCEQGYSGDDCGIVSAFANCPFNCSGHGACSFGTCRCDVGFGGDDCSIVSTTCSNNCTGHGICQATVSSSGVSSFACHCEIGFAGVDCSQVVAGCPGNCTGHGTCFNGTCVCDPGFEPPPRGFGRPDCSLATQVLADDGSGTFLSQCPHNCTGHGTCVGSTCQCYAGYSGASCDQVIGVCPRNCTGHGACDEASGTCVCDVATATSPGYTGVDCSFVDAPCPGDCFGRGRCVRGICRCKSGFSGRDCSIECPGRCSNHGDCNNNTCTCEPGYTGVACEFYNDVTVYPMTSALLAYSPLASFVVYFLFAFGAFFVIGYAFNLAQGLRGSAAVPFYSLLGGGGATADFSLKTSANM